MKQIKFKIDAEGEVTVEVEGAVGAECDLMTEPFEERLGVISEKNRKQEYFQDEQNYQESLKDI